MGSPANSSSLITSKRNPLLLLLSACSQLLLLNQKLRLMPMLCMDTMDMLPTHTPMVMPTMDTMDTHMPTMDTTTARDLLMLKQSQRPRLMLMLSMDTMDMPTHMPMDTTDMPTMDTTDTPGHTVMLTGVKM